MLRLNIQDQASLRMKVWSYRDPQMVVQARAERAWVGEGCAWAVVSFFSGQRFLISHLVSEFFNISVDNFKEGLHSFPTEDIAKCHVRQGKLLHFSLNGNLLLSQCRVKHPQSYLCL